MDSLTLQINCSLNITKRVSPKDSETVYVRRASDTVYLESLKEDVQICLHIDELRAIMRLFDVQSEDE